MYGMVNQAILEYICEVYGDDSRAAVLAAAGSETLQFESMTQYPDEVSYALIGAAAEFLGQPAEAILGKLGEYWVGFALRSDYGDLLRMAGQSLPEILQNLNQLHTRVGQAFADLKPPSFWCDEVTEKSLVLYYASERVGLEPMVVGLVHGLGRLVDVATTVTPTATEPGEPSRFHVLFVARSATRGVPFQQPAPAESSGAA